MYSFISSFLFSTIFVLRPPRQPPLGGAAGAGAGSSDTFCTLPSLP